MHTTNHWRFEAFFNGENRYLLALNAIWISTNVHNAMVYNIEKQEDMR
jgi:hypothetical protein